MNIRVVVGIVALVGVSICGLIAGIKHLKIVDKVNEKIPQGEQFDWIGWYLSKTQRLHREYKRLYPECPLLSQLYIAAALALTSILICLRALGFFGK